MPKANPESGQFSRRTRTVAGATVVSRVLGLVREQVIAYYFGAGAMADVFVAAFRIPNLLRDLFAEGAFSAAFVPTFTKVLRTSGRTGAFDLLNRVLSVFVPVLSLVCILGMIFTPQIAGLLSGGVEATPGKIELLIIMARWMFPFLLLVSLAAAFMGALNALDRFGIPALAPTGFNVGVIVGAALLSRWVEPPLLGLAIGVLIGGILQQGIQAIQAHQLGFRPRWLSGWSDPEVHRILTLMGPALIGIAAVQVNIFAITRLAWTLGDGPVAYLNYAFRVIFLPLGVFAVAAATVGLPRLSQQVAAGQLDEARRTYTTAARTVLYLVVPTAIAFILLAEPICAVLFQRGRFDSAATLHTARALQFYSIGLPAMAVIRVTAPLFYAHHDTRTPALCGVISVVANLIGMSLLVGPFGYRGLALSVAGSAILQLSVLWILARRKYGALSLGTILGNAAAISAISAISVGAVWLPLRSLYADTASWARVALVGSAIAVAALIYIGITWMAGFRDLGGIRRRRSGGQ
ncbi:MAG: murein biosynthesis integral membrane protein MurJ [Candidatus Zixiibacteriota bacterium]